MVAGGNPPNTTRPTGPVTSARRPTTSGTKTPRRPASAPSTTSTTSPEPQEPALAAHNRLGQIPETIVLRDPSPAVRRVLAVAGIDHLFTLQSTRSRVAAH
jgi:hypothetical protein